MKKIVETPFPSSPPSPRTLSVIAGTDRQSPSYPVRSAKKCSTCREIGLFPARWVCEMTHLTGAEMVRQVGTSHGSGRGRTGLSRFAREASRPAGAGLRILRRRCHPFRNTVAGPPKTCRPGTVFGFLLHIAFQVCGTLGHLKRSAAPPRHYKNRKKNIRIVKTCIRANSCSDIFV